MNAGGAQAALLRVARQLRERGHAMEVWFLYQEDAIHEGEPCVRVFEHRAKLSAFSYAIVFIRLIRALRAERPDVVIGFLPLGNVFGLLAARIAQVPWRVASQRSPGTTYGRVMRWCDRLLGSSKTYQSNICVSGAVRQSFVTYPKSYRRKLRVVHNGIEWTESSRTKREARAYLGLPQDCFLYVTVGRLKPQKNYPFLLDALAHVEGVVLAVAGDGDLRKQIEAQAAELGISSRLVLLGVLDAPKLRDLLRGADAFVLASTFEGQSNAVLEAMHEGLPILVGDIPEQRETLIDSETDDHAGLLAPLDNLGAWTAAMTKLRDDPALRSQLGASAKKMVADRFTVERMIDGFERAIFSDREVGVGPARQNSITKA
jgi:glycosyltransferase involved in cell wall biosynthesis